MLSCEYGLITFLFLSWVIWNWIDNRLDGMSDELALVRLGEAIDAALAAAQPILRRAAEREAQSDAALAQRGRIPRNEHSEV